MTNSACRTVGRYRPRCFEGEKSVRASRSCRRALRHHRHYIERQTSLLACCPREAPRRSLIYPSFTFCLKQERLKRPLAEGRPEACLFRVRLAPMADVIISGSGDRTGSYRGGFVEASFLWGRRRGYRSCPGSSNRVQDGKHQSP